MVKESDVTWFKREFGARIKAVVDGTPLTLDHITAIALQETGYIWARLQRKGLPTARILELCVGDTIDETGDRSAFPKNKAELLAAARGQEMFDVARKALVDIAEHFPDYQATLSKPDKFCHGFGMFQYDLQFFKKEPEYFLQRKYADFDAAITRCVGELRRGLEVTGLSGKSSLTD